MDREQLRAYEDLPQANSHRLVDFEQVQIMTLESDPPQYLLVVKGTKPYLNMRVELAPLVYIAQPDYWEIEVVGSLPGGVWLPALAPYTASILLTGITGKVGVEVIGATRRERRRVPPDGETVANCQDWSAVHNRRPPGAVLQVGGKCQFPTSGYSVALERSETQGPNPRELFLELVVHEPGPTDPVQDVVTEVDAVYQEETHTEYDTVTIRGYVSGVPVEVVW